MTSGGRGVRREAESLKLSRGGLVIKINLGGGSVICR